TDRRRGRSDPRRLAIDSRGREPDGPGFKARARLPRPLPYRLHLLRVGEGTRQVPPGSTSIGDTTMSRDLSVEKERLYVLAKGFLDMINTNGRHGFALGRQWWWKVRFWQRGRISLAEPEGARQQRTDAVIAFAKELNEIIKAEVAYQVKAQLAGRER